MSPTRTFKLEINPGILPFTKEKMKGYSGIQLSNGTWFNTKARVPGSQMVQVEYLRNFEKYIKDAIIVESRRLIQFWYTNINKYFNRRAYGMYYYRGNKGGLLSATRRFRGRYSNKQQYRRREHTGQLKRALVLKEHNLTSATLYVKPCYAKSGHPVDYVNILMNGATARPKPYIPVLDKRINIPGKYWRGISRSYWATWQAVFDKQVNAANTRLNRKIEQYVIDKKIMERKDMRKARQSSKITKEIVNIREKEASRPAPKSAKFQPSAFGTKRYNDLLKKFTPK
ncbi:MAG: hypothetical protein WC877_01735 [Dehalococcoidales bacterium]|jgi:hypothetical protein